MSPRTRQPSMAAELLARGRSPKLYEQFKSFQRGEAYFDERFRHPEISGYLGSGALIQVWRNQSEVHSHLVLMGDLRTGSIDYAPLTDVRELSRHQMQFNDELLHTDEASEPPSALLRDFSVLYGEARLNGTTYDMYASADRIRMTNRETGICEGVGDFIGLDGDIYRIQKGMATTALRNAA